MEPSKGWEPLYAVGKQKKVNFPVKPQSVKLLVTSGPDQPAAVLGIQEGFFSSSLSPVVVKSGFACGLLMAVHSPGSALAPQSPTHKQEQ